MSSSFATAFLFFASHDEGDTEFARDLAKQIQPFVTPIFRDVNELVRYNRNWWRRRRGHPGIPIFILSESVVSNRENRRALVEWLQFTHRRGYHHYYICRGIEPVVLQARYADLTPVFEEVMVLREHEHLALVKDMRAYAIRIWPEVTGWKYRLAAVPALARLLVATLLMVASRPLEVLYYLCCLAAAVFGLILLSKSQSSWNLTLTLACMYAGGYGFGKIYPLEIWPYLGPWWLAPQAVLVRLASKEYESTLKKGGMLTLLLLVSWGLAVATLGNFILFTVAFVLGNILRAARFRRYAQKLLHIVEAANSVPSQPELQTLTLSTAICNEEDLKTCLHEWTGARWGNLWGSAIPVSLFLSTGIAAMKTYSAETWIYGVVVFAVGVTAPRVSAWAHRTTAVEWAVERGLTRWMIEREKNSFRSFFAPPWLANSELSQRVFSCFDEAELKQAQRWVAISVAPLGWFTRRWWLARRDYIFISYAWSDDPETGMSMTLAEQLEALGIPFFLDKDATESQFLSWRETLAPALERCTHMFLIVSRNISRAAVLQRELNERAQLAPTPSSVEGVV